MTDSPTVQPMAMTREEFYGGSDPRNLPSYTVRESAHHLGMSESTLRSWIAGSSYQTTKGPRRSDPLLSAARKRPWLLSFWNLVELNVLLAMRKSHNISMPRVRTALDSVEREMNLDRPLVTVDFHTDGVDLFVKHYTSLKKVSKRDSQSLLHFVSASLLRIERDADGLASRLFPWSDSPQRDHNLVSIDPEVAFGQPVVVRTRVPTSELASRHRGGDSDERLAEEFGIPIRTVRAALRWEIGKAA